jgi:hypothetical protein
MHTSNTTQQFGCDSSQPDSISRDDPGAQMKSMDKRKSSNDTSYCNVSHQGDTIYNQLAGVAQLVERQLPKLNVEGSNPFTRFAVNLIIDRDVITYRFANVGCDGYHSSSQY